MQYTSTSFAEPLTRILQPLLRSEAAAEVQGRTKAASLWPSEMRWASTTTDRVLALLYRPLFGAVERAGSRLRAYYRPRVSTSLLYIVLTVLVLLTLLFVPDTPR